MSDTALQLSVPGETDFVFTEMEIPDHITFGGKQKLTVHELVGGARVVDAMGRSDMPLQWSGYLLGQKALRRARFLDYLRTSGKQVMLTWSELFFMVVVEDFSADFERYYNLPYRISFTVVQDLAQPVTTLTQDTLNDSLNSDVAAAMPIVANIGDQLLQAAYNDLQKELKKLPRINMSMPDIPMSVPHFHLPIPNFHLPIPNLHLPYSDGSASPSSLLSGFAAKLATLQSRVNAMISSANQSFPLVDFGKAVANYAMWRQASWLSQQSGTASNMAQLYALRAIARRIGMNIGMGK